ncbi:MAG: hypothetical protein MZW92_72065 [Comamonadaceae bacterium]|nr:hypothetical protein [Comamonadaceae bacterium]
MAEVTTTEYVDGRPQQGGGEVPRLRQLRRVVRRLRAADEGQPALRHRSARGRRRRRRHRRQRLRAAACRRPATPPTRPTPTSSTRVINTTLRLQRSWSEGDDAMGASPLMSLGMRGDGRQLRRAADHRPQHRQRQRRRATRASASSWRPRRGQFSGAGFFGKGVDVVSVSRAHDDLPHARGRADRASQAAHGQDAPGAAAAAGDRCSRPASSGLGYAAAQQFLNAMVDLASRPAGHRRRARWCWRAPASWRRASPPPARPARRSCSAASAPT